jgi:hypothetical protein
MPVNKDNLVLYFILYVAVLDFSLINYVTNTVESSNKYKYIPALRWRK